MKISRKLFFLIPLVLSSCNLIPSKGGDQGSNSNDSFSSTEGGTMSSSNSQSSTSSSSSNSSSNSSTLSTTQSDDDYLNNREVLPCGYVKLDKPTNTPINITTSTSHDDWYTANTYDYLPEGYTFIYGNSSSSGPSGHYANTPFYSYNESDTKQYPGGIKITKRSQGLQSAMFSHSGAKLEIRIGISQVNNANGPIDDKKPTAYLYFYDKDGGFMSDNIIEVQEETITTAKAGNYISYYVTKKAEDIAYFEFRLNAQPYKGSQNYNFGIGYVSIHSWTYA